MRKQGRQEEGEKGKGGGGGKREREGFRIAVVRHIHL